MSARDGRAAFEAAETRLFARYGVSARRREVEAAGIRTRVLEVGDGEPLVLLHGGGGAAAFWAPIVPLLRPRHRCLIPDRPGCGGSANVDYRRVPDLRAHASGWVEGTLDTLGLDRATLVANSMGGYFALAFAADHPGRVDRLVLPGVPAGLDRRVPGFLRALATPGLNRLLWSTLARPSTRTLRTTFRKVLVGDVDRVVPEMLECGVRNYLVPGNDVGWLSLLERALDPGGFRRRWLLGDDLRRVRAPTTLVVGDRDVFEMPGSLDAAVDAMPDARLVRVPGAGHLPWIDEPARVASAVLAVTTAAR